MLSLKVTPREIGGKLYKIREEGRMPAVFYGKKEASTPVSVSMVDFAKVWKQAGESSVVILNTEKGDIEALIHDVDIDPVTEVPRHADFYVFEKGHKIKLDIPLEFVGVSPAVKDLGGILIKVMHKVKIEAMPKDLPPKLEVDISTLATINSQILAGSIKIPNGVVLIEDPAEVVALISLPQEEKEEEAPVDLTAIEVEKKGKKDEEGAEGEGSGAGAGDAGKAPAKAPKAEKEDKK